MSEPLKFPRRGERTGAERILRDLLEQVERGEVVEVMVIGKYYNGDWLHTASFNDDRLASIGILEVLKYRLIRTVRGDE